MFAERCPAVHRCLVKSAVYTAISCVTIRGHVESATTRCLPRRGYPGNFKDGISEVRPRRGKRMDEWVVFVIISGWISIIIWTYRDQESVYIFIFFIKDKKWVKNQLFVNFIRSWLLFGLFWPTCLIYLYIIFS